MGFLGIYRAVYDYVPQAESELPITDGDLLFVLEKNSDDDWWKAKKKASAEDEEEPIGIIPNNYIEEAEPVGTARALFEYTRQTDEELSFPEDATLEVFDTSDPDWILVGLDGEFGFVPSNYIELQESHETAESYDVEESQQAPPSLPARPVPATSDFEGVPDRRAIGSAPAPSQVDSPATALAGVIHGRSSTRAATSPPLTPQSAGNNTSEASDEDDGRTPALPTRPTSQIRSSKMRPEMSTEPRRIDPEIIEPSPVHRTPGGFHMYNINEMVSVMGKRKKMPTTLGINLGTGTILVAPERAQDGPSHEWTADKMTHYSREGKHVFLELVRPSKSVDFHAGAKDTAEEIVSALGELAGAIRAEGLRDVILAGTGQSQKKGQVLYDFMAQGDDEVTVAVGDEVLVIDDTKSEEWWQVRRLKNGKEGVVPSSYIEVTGVLTPPPSSMGLSLAKSTVEQNRLEEVRLTKEAVKTHQKDTAQQVGPGMQLPERGSSLLARDNGNNSGQQRSKRENGRAESGSQPRSSKSKPDSSKVRTWTDRSKSFSVEAQFLGLKDGKLNLHKMNGVKIAVPIAKMSVEDLEYVERATGISLDEDKPLSNVKKAMAASENRKASGASDKVSAGATVEQARKSEYDWFQFFLSCDVAVGLCERYAQAFAKDSMDESVLPDVDAAVLRTLGLREGDILKVMRTLDAKYSRTGSRSKRNVSFAGDQGGGDSDGEGNAAGGLFSGPGGALRNNTRKGRPAPAIQTSDVVDPKAFSRMDESKVDDHMDSKSPTASAPAVVGPGSKGASGFDDDAWDVKPVKEAQRATAPRTAEPVPTRKHTQQQPLTGSMQELSLLTAPLEPTKVQPAQAAGTNSDATVPTDVSTAQVTTQPTGATPSFFATVNANHQTGPGDVQPTQQTLPRQRPAVPAFATGQASLMPPPPPRALSAPQSAQPSAFAPPPLLPQMTGVSGQGGYQAQVAPPGQSLGEIHQARLQQQYAQHMQQQMQNPSINAYTLQAQGPGVMPFNTALQQPMGQFMQPMMTGAHPGQSPFADPIRSAQFSPIQAQATGFPTPYSQQQSFTQIPNGNINSFLPPAMEPQRTGAPAFQPQPTGVGGYNSIGGGGPIPPQPLLPQKTGPPPPVRFGVSADAKKLMPQATGRRANLSQATPQNPFGF